MEKFKEKGSTLEKLDWNREIIKFLCDQSRNHMPVDIINGYPFKLCGGVEIKAKKESIFYWVEVNHLLREDKTSYICSNCDSVLIQVIHHSEEKY